MFLSKVKTIILSFSITVFALSLIIMPQESFDASIRGLNMWWEIVFPSLLPFFIISELLIGFGVVRFIGVILEPVMRPFFRVPGAGGFVWAMGMASGFPAGAKLTARLRQDGQLSRHEAERLVSFSNASNPLFIFGAVSVGFFKDPSLGIVLAIAHYVGNFFVGIAMRFYGYKKDYSQVQTKKKKKTTIRSAFAALHRTRVNDKRPIGKLLGDAVTSSIQTLLMIGGFIILFSVVSKMLFHLHITSFLALGITGIFTMFNLPDTLSIPFISGLFEMTLGAQMTSGVQEATLLQQAILTSFILGFSGFSVQAQVASILAQTDIRFQPFFFARILHGFIAAFITLIIWNPIYKHYSNNQPSNAMPVFNFQNETVWTDMLAWLTRFGPLITIGALIVYIIINLKQDKTSRQ